MVPKLYMTEVSSSVRSVLLTAKSLNVELEKIYINMMAKEHLSPSYLKLNPQHTVPTLVDDNKVIWESHAIMIYLVQKYSPNDDSLYPADQYKRAKVNQFLYFNSGVLFPPFRKAVIDVLYKGKKDISLDLIAEIKEAFQFLEKDLEGRLYIAGDTETLADHALIPNVTSINVILKLAPTDYPNLTAWIKRVEKLPCYVVEIPGLKLTKKIYNKFFVNN